MKKLIIFLFIICFVASMADASVIPTDMELNACNKAFNGKKSYWAFVVFLCSCFVFAGCVLALLYSFRRKKKDIDFYMKRHTASLKKIMIGFVAVLSLFLVIQTAKFLPKNNPSACLDYKMCEEQYEWYKYNVNLWCYENIHLIKNHWNSTNSVCLNECLAFNADKTSLTCKKCEAQHWQFKVFGKFEEVK